MKNRIRNVGINIRVTEQEKKKIIRNAKRCKLSVSEYLRQIAEGREPREAIDERIFAICRRLQQTINVLQDEWMKKELEVILSDLYTICYTESEVSGHGNYEDMAGPR